MNLNQVTVPSIDVAKSISFYQTLGLKLIVEALPHYARFECPDCAATSSIHQTEGLPKGEGIHLYFECENLDRDVSELIAKGVTLDLLPTDQSWLWREARLKDVDGNQLVLFHAGENRLNPPWRIDDKTQS